MYSCLSYHHISIYDVNVISYIFQKTMGIQIDVNKGVAIAAVKSVFGPICPDAAAGLANRVATLPPPTESKNSKACDLDHLLELCLDKWQTLNETWRVINIPPLAPYIHGHMLRNSSHSFMSQLSHFSPIRWHDSQFYFSIRTSHFQ
jgi:hypothetical protein